MLGSSARMHSINVMCTIVLMMICSLDNIVADKKGLLFHTELEK